MPTWNFTLTGSDVALGRAVLLAARVDPNIVEVVVEEDSGTLLRFSLDTGPEPEPLARNVWDFIRTHSDEWVMNNGRNPYPPPDAATIYEYARTTLVDRPLVGFREQAAQIVENYLRQSAELMDSHRMQMAATMRAMALPLARRTTIDPRSLIPLQQMPLPSELLFLPEPQLRDGSLPDWLPVEPSEDVGRMTIPVWCVKGTWVEEKRHRTAAQIITVDTVMFSVSLKIWKTEPALFLSMNLGQLVEEWIPTEKEPTAGRPWYERLDDE